MEALVLNTEFQAVGIVDVFESFIWTDRYSSYGDFEIYSQVTEDMVNLLQNDYFLWSEDSEHTMIVEGRKIQTDIEQGNHMTVVGRSLESILTRRVIWETTELGHVHVDEDDEDEEWEENFQEAILKLLCLNCIENPGDEGPRLPEEPYADPSWVCDEDRIIPNMRFVASNDQRIIDMTVKAQIPAGCLLYDVIKSLCDERGVGFKVTLSNDNHLLFSLYMGEDRSYNQVENPYVVFSPAYDNLLNTNYTEDYTAFKNAALVIGGDDGDEQLEAKVANEYATGLNRREVYIDASDMSWENEDGDLYEEDEYKEQLAQRGKETLAELKTVEAFEGEAEYRRTFEYGRDFKIGDIVQLENEYGITACSRITEMIFSHDGSGINAIPTFEAIRDDEDTSTVTYGNTNAQTLGSRMSSYKIDVSLNSHANIVAADSTLSVYETRGIATVTLHLKLIGSFSSFTTIANGLPEAAEDWYDTACDFDENRKRDLRIRVNTNGDLAVRFGEGTSAIPVAYRISFAYPIRGVARHASGGGGTGTDDYEQLRNLPRIEGNTVVGNKTFSDLGMVALTNAQIDTIFARA